MKVSKLVKVGLLGIIPLATFVIGCLSGSSIRVSLMTARDIRSMSRFEQIRIALLCYHADHGSFPATKYISKEGKVHSWRAMLLPYISGIDRFPEYDLSKNWDDVENLKVISGGDLFTSQDSNSKEHMANYLCIGSDDVWPWNRPMRSYCVVKDDDRFLLVEDLNSTIHWMEPRF